MEDTATIQDWLEARGFDWATGIVVVQETDDADFPGWARADEITVSRYAQKGDPILTQKFDSGYGGPECPCFWAKDKDTIYFPTQYDGSTNICKVSFLPDYYLAGNPTPYPGG